MAIKKHGRIPSDGGRSSMVEHRVVVPRVTGSTPVGHPKCHIVLKSYQKSPMLGERSKVNFYM